MAEDVETPFLSLLLLAPVKSFNPNHPAKAFWGRHRVCIAERLSFLERVEKFMEYLKKTQTNPKGVF